MINTQTQITNPCTKCGTDTGATWKTLCRLCWKKQSPDEIRAYRQAKLERKVARLNKWADSKEKQADSLTSEFRSYHGDISFFTQPNINTSSGRAFTRRRERIYAKFDSGMRLSIEADKMREKAQWLQNTGAVVKGDAERKRQAKREAADAAVNIGDIAHHFLYDDVEILKKNKKTFTVKVIRTGSVFPVEKSHIEIPNKKGGE